MQHARWSRAVRLLHALLLSTAAACVPQVEKLEYLDAVMQEALRLHHAAPVMLLEAERDVQVGAVALCDEYLLVLSTDILHS